MTAIAKSAGIDKKSLLPPKGHRPVLQFCRLHELNVDHSYQRSIANGTSRTRIRRIAREWDWDLCQTLVVSRRPDDSLWIVDGQHRQAGATLRGDIYDLPCLIHTYPGVAEEAAHFVALNQSRRPLSAMDMFNAAIASGDRAALSVMLLIEGAGLSLASHTNFTAWKPGQVSNIAGIQRCYKVHGSDLTRRALKALADAYPGQVLRYGGTLFAGIAGALVELGGGVDSQLLVLVLGGASQAEWIKEIGALEADQGIHRQVAAAQAIKTAYQEALVEEADEREAAE
ncbi:MAG: DUF6551 family protein [Sphingomonas sp.]